MPDLAMFISRYAISVLLVSCTSCHLLAAEICGVTVTPHVLADSMMYRKPRDQDLAAKVQLFVKGSASPRLWDGKSPSEHLASGDWAWHDLGTAVQGTEDSLSVWTWNGKTSRWGIGNTCEVEGVGLSKTSISIDAPKKWVSAITFLADEAESKPRQMIAHIVNSSDGSLKIASVRLWLPRSGATWQTLYAQEARVVDVQIPPRDRGVVNLSFKEPLPLTYAALELSTDSGSLWAHLRIKSEQFDISGGWIGDHLKEEPYLKLLSRLHVNCGQIQNVAGYTDNEELYQRYPMKLFNRMWPLDTWDREKWLPKIHAVEFLGEPQYGGGRPVAPQEVFDKLLPYRTSRLATSVTNSEERIWRFYAGLSDYPHYDAYRVVAPAADSWRAYNRWGGQRITWGAPLETIGDMCRSLRELSRPMPVAYWSQGPHDGWGSGFGLSARQRRSPTPDELRAQAMHALSTRITSLYWFNLSLKSLLKFPDTWDPIMRIGREIQMLSPFYLSGDAFQFERTRSESGQLDWDCASIVSEECAILFANDIAYEPDSRDNTFRFGQPRDFSYRYPLPHWLREPTDVFRVDADGIHAVEWSPDSNGVFIKHQFSRDAIFVATKLPSLRTSIEARRQAAIAKENSLQVDVEVLKLLIRN
ncbi:MAG: hypothetical protein ACK56W_15710 [Pirellula sp.]|jgi:hypothetical protein